MKKEIKLKFLKGAIVVAILKRRIHLKIYEKLRQKMRQPCLQKSAPPGKYRMGRRTDRHYAIMI